MDSSLKPLISPSIDVYTKNLQDRINLTFNGDDKIKNAINKNIEYVKSETLSNNIQFNVKVDGGLDLIFDKLKTKIFITKV